MTDTRETDPKKYLDECTRIEPMCIQEEYVRLPGDMSYWNERYAHSYRRWLEVKIAREQIYYRVWREAQDQLIMSGKGKVTLAEVEAGVVQDPSYTQIEMEKAQCEGDKVLLAGIMECLRAKKEMLISLGAHLRMEMGGDPMIRTQTAIEREVDRNKRGG